LSDKDVDLIDKIMRGRAATPLKNYHVEIGSKDLVGEIFPA